MAATVAPVFGPAGFGEWHTAGALMVGFVAKEALISSWGQTYATGESDARTLGATVRSGFESSSGGHPEPAGLAFLLFVLGYTPCVATMTAQIREIGLRWTMTGIGLSLVLSWLVAVTAFQVGRIVW